MSTNATQEIWLQEKNQEITRLRAALKKYSNEDNWFPVDSDFTGLEQAFNHKEPWTLAQEALNGD